MIPKEFSEYFNSCDQVNQQIIIEELLQITMEKESLPETSDVRVLKCPHCNCKAIRGNGKLKGMQRYVCKECNKNFSQSTGKFWFALKKRGLLIKYMYCLISGYSIRKSAMVTGISIQTSFDWRHKLLTSFKAVLPDGFRGIVEMNDLTFQYSEKGNRRKKKKENGRTTVINKAVKNEELVVVIATCDRNGNEDIRVVTQGCIHQDDIIKSLEGRTQKAEVLVSTGHNSQLVICDKIKIDLKNSDSKKRLRKAESIYHIRNVNNMYSRLLRFMNPFHGVATKYLQNYLNWFLVLERIKDTTKKISTAGHLALSTDRAWFDFKSKNINIYFRT